MEFARMDSVRSERDLVAAASDDPSAARLAELARLFPEVMTDGSVDFDRLREVLGDTGDTRPERYGLMWAGKRDALRAAQMPSRATLVPKREQSLDFATTHNIFVEGDNLEVFKLLHRAYVGRVKLIYLDPRYNIGNDYV